jgi:hypothetical protein
VSNLNPTTLKILMITVNWKPWLLNRSRESCTLIWLYEPWSLYRISSPWRHPAADFECQPLAKNWRILSNFETAHDRAMGVHRPLIGNHSCVSNGRIVKIIPFYESPWCPNLFSSVTLKWLKICYNIELNAHKNLGTIQLRLAMSFPI